MPYLLLQIILAYEKNPALSVYTAFVITLKGPTSQFITASCSVSYIHDMVSTRMPGTSLEVKFSLPYNLLEPEDRHEFMKLYYGLLQYLYDKLRNYDAWFFFFPSCGVCLMQAESWILCWCWSAYFKPVWFSVLWRSHMRVYCCDRHGPKDLKHRHI